MAFPKKKTAFFDDFPLCPQCSLPPQKRIYFNCRLTVSEPGMGCVTLVLSFRDLKLEGKELFFVNPGNPSVQNCISLVFSGNMTCIQKRKEGLLRNPVLSAMAQVLRFPIETDEHLV